MSLSRLWKIALALIVIGAVVYAYPPLRLSAMVLAGRSPNCPFSLAVQSEQNMRDQIAIKDRILAASRRVGRDSRYQLWATPSGRFWVPEGSEYVLPFNLAEQERRIYGSGPNFVRSGDVVLDCGANIGVFTRVALEAGARTVVAIEPAPENLECLRRNFETEIAAGRVIVYPKGVWDKDDMLALQVDARNSAADSFVMHPKDAHATVEKLPLTTIDKLVAELKLPRVDFIKMDIEGAEVRAVNGARETISRWHPRMALSVYHVPDHPVMVPRAVKAAWPGYAQECGPCATDGRIIRPDVFYFH
ncbi:MAG: FkbM family methyltransferase [Acidobacteria bacterium]|nr:FkbM family methyltransferase [Acidobacteriota bacterium]